MNFNFLFKCATIFMNNYRNVAQYRLFCSFNPERFSNHICIVNYNIVNLQNRTYAKGKDKKKEKGKVKVQINETQLSEVINVEAAKNEMQRILESLKINYTKHVSLRSTSGSIESIPVKVDGKEHTLQEIAQIVRKNPKLIVVNMAAFPQVIPVALKAISNSGLNLSPQQEGTTLYIPVPKVTKEHRQDLLKNAKALFVKCRDGIRDIQNKQTKTIKKQENLPKDFVYSAEQQVIALADTYIKQAEEVFENKQTELIGKD